MPCRTDHMEPNEAEEESKRVATFLCFIDHKLGFTPTGDLVAISSDYYGAPNRVEQLTVLLCDTIRGMNPTKLNSVVYDGRDPMSRRLADWWDKHQEDDRRHEAAHEKANNRAKLKATALKKLTLEEREALGL